jgi:hypothetical protein
MLPVFALGLVVVLHWEAVVNARWSLGARAHPLPGAWTAGVLVLLAPGLLLILEELARGLRAQRHA